MKRKNLLAIVGILLIIILGVAAIFVSARISGGTPVAPTAPSASKACDAECPSASNPSLLISCTASADGSFQSSCNATGRIESCGGSNYCCPSVGGTWTKNMTNCPTVTVTVAQIATAAGTIAECGTCSGTATCLTGFACDTVDSKCKKADGTSVCYTGATACIAEATVGCVATDVITCSPDCPTECGTAASTISTCKDSCNVAKTKACPATVACGEVDINITKKAFKDETANVAGNYRLTTEISTVSKEQVFVYSMTVSNPSTIAITDAVLTDTLDGENQDQLTYMDTDSGCVYDLSSRTITCDGIDLASKADKILSFRVKVSDSVVNGDVIKNLATITLGDISKDATKDLNVLTVVGCSQSCTSDSDCSGSLVCDPTSSMCRREACLPEESCTCPVATGTTAPTGVATQAPLGEVIIAEPTVLPETGILDFPGVAAFGGGLLLAIIGILLAL